MPTSANHGAVFLEVDDRSPRPPFADAQCVTGTLIVRELRPAPRDITTSLLDDVMGPEDPHPIEYPLFFTDVRANAEHRAALILRRSSNKRRRRGAQVTAPPPSASMLPIPLSLTALATDIVIDHEPPSAVSGVARASPDQPSRRSYRREGSTPSATMARWRLRLRCIARS